MDENVVLKIYDRSYGQIIIPFLGLEELDWFTVRYSDKKELINALSNLLKLPISQETVLQIVVHCQYQKNDETRYVDLPVKYKDDNFDIAYIESSLATYIKQNPERIKYTGVKEIKTVAITEFLAGEKNGLSDFDIDLAVRKYLTNAPYRMFRKVYFTIKDKVPVRKKRVPLKNRLDIDRNLSKFSSTDDYIDSLLQYALKGEEECERVLEELSLIDLEELGRKIESSHYGIFDGLDEDDEEMLQELSDLELYSGYDIESLITIANQNIKGRHKR